LSDGYEVRWGLSRFFIWAGLKFENPIILDEKNDGSGEKVGELFRVGEGLDEYNPVRRARRTQCFVRNT
jgi:hypothetical protein